MFTSSTSSFRANVIFHEGGVTHRKAKREATQAPRQRHRIPIPALAKRGYGMAKTALPIEPSFVCVALLSRKKVVCDLAAVPSAVRFACRCCVCLFAHARPTMASISLVKDNWGERERAPTLLMSMEIVYVRPHSTATLRMRERCSNSADLAAFKNQLVLELFVSGPGNVPNTARKRPSEDTRTTQATGPRQAY